MSEKSKKIYKVENNLAIEKEVSLEIDDKENAFVENNDVVSNDCNDLLSLEESYSADIEDDKALVSAAREGDS